MSHFQKIYLIGLDNDYPSSRAKLTTGQVKKMTKIIKKLKDILNRGPAPYEAEGFRSGFALLFAVVISSIILAIALGVANIAFKEVKFSSSAQGANDAFFAADTGAECALFYDIKNNSFFGQQQISSISCGGNIIIPVYGNPTDGFYFSVPNLGSSQQGCAFVTITQDTTASPITTLVVSKGYNNATVSQQGGSCTPGANAVERQLEVSY